MKNKLLISSSSRTFIQLFGPIIPELAKTFRIVVLLEVLKKVTIPSNAFQTLESWNESDIISKYILTPDSQEGLKFHLFMKQIVKELKNYDFDLWLGRSEMGVGDRYVLDCVLPEKCIKVAMWPLITYLLQRQQNLVRQLLSASEMKQYLPAPSDKIPETNTRLQRIVKKINRAGSPINIAQKIFIYCTAKLKSSIKVHTRYLIDREILPKLMVGKRFEYGPYDQITQIGSGRIDAYIFCDEIEVEAHKLIFKTPNVYLAQYPASSSCRCHMNPIKKTTLLCPLSGWETLTQIPEEALLLYSRDIQTVLSETGATSVHLRKHPDFKSTGGWSKQLQTHLETQCLEVKVIGCETPIGDIACDYLCVASFATAALRDLRSYCNEVIIIGFMGVSKFYFSDPRFVYGKSEGIGWIEEDGSYTPLIFEQKRYVPTAKQSIPDIMVQLLEQQL